MTFWRVSLCIKDAHTAAKQLYNALFTLMVNTTGHCCLARVMLFNEDDQLRLDDVVRRIEPDGHRLVLPSLAAAAVRAGFRATADPNIFDPPSKAGTHIALFAWSKDVLASGERVIHSYVDRHVGRGILTLLCTWPEDAAPKPHRE
jgi:hypothetical protein